MSGGYSHCAEEKLHFDELSSSRKNDVGGFCELAIILDGRWARCIIERRECSSTIGVRLDDGRSPLRYQRGECGELVGHVAVESSCYQPEISGKQEQMQSRSFRGRSISQSPVSPSPPNDAQRDDLGTRWISPDFHGLTSKRRSTGRDRYSSLAESIVVVPSKRWPIRSGHLSTGGVNRIALFRLFVSSAHKHASELRIHMSSDMSAQAETLIYLRCSGEFDFRVPHRISASVRLAVLQLILILCL